MSHPILKTVALVVAQAAALSACALHTGVPDLSNSSSSTSASGAGGASSSASSASVGSGGAGGGSPSNTLCNAYGTTIKAVCAKLNCNATDCLDPAYSCWGSLNKNPQCLSAQDAAAKCRAALPDASWACDASKGLSATGCTTEDGALATCEAAM